MIEELERLLAEHSALTAEEKLLDDEAAAIRAGLSVEAAYRNPRYREIQDRLDNISPTVDDMRGLLAVESNIAYLVVKNQIAILAALKQK